MGTGFTLVLESSGLLLVVVVVGAVIGSRGARSPIVVVGVVVGIVAVVITQLLPGGIGFLGDALRFEVPKTVHYWLSTIAAVGAAAALAHGWSTGRLPSWLARVASAPFVAVAALPLRPEPIDAYHLGEHRLSETFAIDLRYAGQRLLGWLPGFASRSSTSPAGRSWTRSASRSTRAGRTRHARSCTSRRASSNGSRRRSAYSTA